MRRRRSLSKDDGEVVGFDEAWVVPREGDHREAMGGSVMFHTLDRCNKVDTAVCHYRGVPFIHL